MRSIEVHAMQRGYNSLDLQECYGVLIAVSAIEWRQHSDLCEYEQAKVQDDNELHRIAMRAAKHFILCYQFDATVHIHPSCLQLYVKND